MRRAQASPMPVEAPVIQTFLSGMPGAYHRSVSRFLWTCFGGALGTGARYLVILAAPRLLGAGFPWGTLIVNVVGSFTMALIAGLGPNALWLTPSVRVALTTGLLGGFTTYSAFNQETLAALQAGQTGLAALYVASTLVVCLLAGLLGFAAGRAFAG
jgi:CrcB protein